MANLSRTPFPELIIQIDDFLSYLKGQKIDLHPGSVLAKSVAMAQETARASAEQSIPSELDPQSGTDALANVAYLGRAILAARESGFEKELRQLLRHLGSGDPSPLTPSGRSYDRDRIFELVCGCVCTQFASDVRFQEPDICCTFEGETWGLACKVAYGKPSTVLQAIRKGHKQIRTAGVSRGLVVVNVTNSFPHGAMYAREDRSGDVVTFHEMRPQQWLFEENLRATTRPIEKLLAERKVRAGLTAGATEGVAFVAHTLAYFRGMRCRMGGLLYFPLNGILPPRESFLGKLNDYWQKL